MDIDRMAKEWPDMKRRLAALEQSGAGRPAVESQPVTAYTPDMVEEVQRAFETLRLDAERLIERMDESRRALDVAREVGPTSGGELRHEAKTLVDTSGL